MSEPTYETPKEVPSILVNMGTGIVSYLIGPIDNSYGNTTESLFKCHQNSHCLMAFTHNHLIIGELNKGNNSTKDLVIPYNNISKLNYYERSKKLEVVTKENKKFLIKVSKDVLNSSIKNLNYDFKMNYIKEDFKISNKFKLNLIIALGAICAAGIIYKLLI